MQVQLKELQQSSPIPSTTVNTLEEVERERILQALQETGGVVGGRVGAAARLGLKRTTLLSKMQKLGISRHINYAAEMQKAASKELL